MKNQIQLAFLTAALVASFLYAAYFCFQYYLRFGVVGPMGIVVFMFIGALMAIGVFAVPIYLVLVYFKLDKPGIYLVLGTLLGGFVIGSAETGVLLNHPEGFFIGLVSALPFNYVRSRDDFKNPIKTDA